MSDYKQNETTRFPNVLFRSISPQKKLHRVSLVEFEEFKCWQDENGDPILYRQYDGTADSDGEDSRLRVGAVF